MSILSFLLGEKRKSALVAKERLQLIIAHERAAGRAPADYLPALQQELVSVISKYVKITNNDIRVHLERQDDLEVIEVKIEIPQP
ncbi:cell division topological specificity factor MinE [Candidatus Vallotia tarda]|uniref:Cell division topological specificity factor n=1 Tax=Candidatus Vallotiella hemipterorum TaxID=1177213 RepID=A0A916JSY4_9BURK|nr:cell division topological specificity factor MinE [Candidatus Vallotia tarda]CAG7600784.1 Cell division topological specificity factor [Candidatus Vallotia tarda]